LEGLVNPQARVARIQIVTPDSDVLIGHTLQLGIRAFSSAGAEVPAPAVRWESGDPGFVTVDSSGLVTATLYSLAGSFPVYATAVPAGLADTFRIRVHLWGEVKWRVPLGLAPVMGGPAQGPDGTLYVLGELDTVSFAAATLFAVTPGGHVKWQQRLAQVNATNFPIVGSDGTVYVVGQYVWAFNADGSLRWSITARPNVRDAPDMHEGALSADGVLFAAMGDSLFAFRAATGDTLWVGLPAPNLGWVVPPSVSADGHTLYLAWSGEAFYAFDASTGARRWALTDPDSAQFLVTYGNGPAVYGGLILVHRWGQLMALDTSGTPLGLAPDVGELSEPAIAEDGTLYGQTYAQQFGLHAFRPLTTQLWQADGYRIRNRWSGGPALAQGRILDAPTTVAFYSLQLSDTGVAVRWRYPKTGNLNFEGAPLIGPDGTVYTFTSCEYGRGIGPCTDELIAFWDDKPVDPMSPWPMWRHDARRSGQADR